jgi:hypothetical protein
MEAFGRGLPFSSCTFPFTALCRAQVVE